MQHQRKPVIRTLLAAVLFGLSAPLIKLLLDSVHPVQMASLLYMGSAAGLFIAIPVAMANNYFSKKVKIIMQHLEIFSREINASLHAKRKMINE